MKTKRETNQKTQTQKENTQTTRQAKHDKHKTKENETLGKTRGDKQDAANTKEENNQGRQQEKTKPEQERDSEIATMTLPCWVFHSLSFTTSMVLSSFAFALCLLSLSSPATLFCFLLPLLLYVLSSSYVHLGALFGALLRLLFGVTLWKVSPIVLPRCPLFDLP